MKKVFEKISRILLTEETGDFKIEVKNDCIIIFADKITYATMTKIKIASIFYDIDTTENFYVVPVIVDTFLKVQVVIKK